MVSKSTANFSGRAASRANNRAALLTAAAELLAETGYQGTSVAAVAERAGLTKGAVYSIFGSKIALFGALTENQNDGFALSNVAEPGTPLREAFGAVGRYWSDFARQPESRAALLLGYELGLDTLRSGETTDDARHIAGRVIERFADELDAFSAASGEPLPHPSRDLAIAVLGAMEGVAMLHVMGLVTVDEAVFIRTAQGVLA